MKNFEVLAIVLLLLGTVGAAGCLAKDPTTTQEHNATLEKFVNVTKQAEYSNKTKEILAWLVTWNNDFERYDIGDGEKSYRQQFGFRQYYAYQFPI